MFVFAENAFTSDNSPITFPKFTELSEAQVVCVQ